MNKDFQKCEKVSKDSVKFWGTIFEGLSQDRDKIKAGRKASLIAKAEEKAAKKKREKEIRKQDEKNRRDQIRRENADARR